MCGCVSNATEYWNANTRRKECRCKEDFVPSSNECIGQGAYFTNDDVETFFIDRKVTTLTITLKDSANYPSG